VIISASPNLADWQAIYTNVPVIGTLDYVDSDATNRAQRHYRAMETDLALGPLRLATLGPVSNGLLRLHIDGLSGLGSAVVYHATELGSGYWEPIATNSPAIGSWELTWPAGSNSPSQFFRVIERR
jgi:hypothetical protein